MIGVFSNSLDDVSRLDLPFKPIATGEEEIEQIDGLFLDWVSPDRELDFIYQAKLLETFIKKVPVVIFDRYFSLTEKEVEYVKKFNVHLFEPAIKNRKEFVYLPIWISDYSILESDKRDFDVVHIYKNIEYRIGAFEKWYVEYSRLFPHSIVGYYTRNLKDFKKKEYEKSNLKFIESEVIPNYSISNFTIAIDTNKAYEIGYFDPMYFFVMNQGCVPLLPMEHRFFHCIFKNLVVKDLKDVEYYVTLYKYRDMIIEDIFSDIKKYFPEFTIEYVSDIVRKCYE